MRNIINNTPGQAGKDTGPNGQNGKPHEASTKNRLVRVAVGLVVGIAGLWAAHELWENNTETIACVSAGDPTVMGDYNNAMKKLDRPSAMFDPAAAESKGNFILAPAPGPEGKYCTVKNPLGWVDVVGR